MGENLRNWAGNYEYKAARVHRPTTIEEVQEVVSRSRRAKALGSRHSFNAVADTAEDLISTEHLHRVDPVDQARRTVTLGAGTTYGKLARHLQREGFALPNLASLPHISVAGACATGTHGSGIGNGCLSTSVAGLEIVRADGSLVTLSRGDADFAGAVVGLGGLGIVTAVTLNVIPTYEIRQTVYEGLPLARLERDFEAIEASAYSVSLFTTWRGDTINQVWVKRGEGDADSGDEFFGAKRADGPRHPLPGVSAENCTEQMGVPGPWHERLPHFRMEFTPSNGEELQSEYLLPRERAYEALVALDGIRDRIAPLLFVSEIRTIAADDLWTSPAYERDCVGIHFTWKPDEPSVHALLPEIEAALAPFGARPHWGKQFLMGADRIAPLYPRMEEFRALLRSYDPEGKFRNAFLEEKVFGTA